MTEDQPAVTVLDCRGQRCPMPIVNLARALPTLAVGAVLRVLADDQAAASDIRAWCRIRGQEYLDTGQSETHDIRRRR